LILNRKLVQKMAPAHSPGLFAGWLLLGEIGSLCAGPSSRALRAVREMIFMQSPQGLFFFATSASFA
jgi:hypothetical protein